MRILITGASGKLGRLVVQRLIARGADPKDIVAGARDTAKVADLAASGVTVVALDYTQPATIESALAGIDAVLLISSSEIGQRVAQHQAVINAAVAARVAKFVYTSAPKATTSDLILAPEHKATEEAIAAAQLPSVILRNNWYTENYSAELERGRDTGTFAASVGAGRVASATRTDYADAAAAVLLSDGHIGEVYELGGDVAWDYDELAVAISEVTGRPVVYQSLSTEQHTAMLKSAGMDAGTIGFVTALDDSIRTGALADADGTLSRLIGRPATPLIDGLRAMSG